MALTLITAPATEPITSAEAKSHLRVDHSDEDTHIGTLIVAARQWVENAYGLALVPQVWEHGLDRFPLADRLRIPKPPLLHVTSVKYHDDDLSTVSTFPSSSYQVDAAARLLVLKNGESWPSDSLRGSSGVVVRFVAGYASSAVPDDAEDPTDYTAAVPSDIKHALKLLVAQMYAHREPEVTGTIISRVQFAVDSLLAPYRVWD